MSDTNIHHQSSPSGKILAPKKPFYKSEVNQVRYTGDWSSDSKLSAINNGYWEDPFFRFFNNTEASKKLRRTSLICRGYYVRFRVCDYFLRRIIREINQPVQIVSLGCGMDTTYFRILPELEPLISRFYELDFKSVITAKKSIILHNEILQVMADTKLRLLHCDLRHVSSLEDALRNGEFDFNKPTLFYSECVVNYLRPHENFNILQWISENVPNSLWLAYEQCNANDSFGQIMVSHFLKNGCPLLSLISAQSREDQESQLIKANFEEAKVINAWDAFLKIGAESPPYFPPVNQKEQQFDEYEQLLATCLHYSVRVGINGSLLGCERLTNFLKEFNNQDPNHQPSNKEIQTSTNYFSVKSYPLSCLPKLTGHRAVVNSEGTILTFGGSGENSRRMKHLIASRINFQSVDLLLSPGDKEEEEILSTLWCNSASELSVETRILSENSKFYERLHSSAVYIPSPAAPVQEEGVETFAASDRILIFGGRKSPLNCSNDLIQISPFVPFVRGDVANILSSAYGCCPEPRWRHAMSLCTKDGSPHLLLFGGRSTEKVLGDCWLYSTEDSKWKEQGADADTNEDEFTINRPSPRHSHSMTSNEDGSVVYILGGMSENDASLCQDAFWVYNVSSNNWSLNKELNMYARRIGHVAIKHKNNLIIFGGYGADSSYSLDLFAIIIDLELNIVKSISSSIPRDELFLPFGFSACLVNDKVVIFGGGGNCFSFGTHYNTLVFVCSTVNPDLGPEDDSTSI